jgi:dihydroorotate dehydrogenase electron transfer subunit
MEQFGATLIKNELLTEDIVRMTMLAPSMAANAKPGQFVTIKIGRGHDPLLRRPFSIHQVNTNDGTMQVVFKVLGKGTKALAELRAGALVDMVGPLGNHFRPGEAMCLVGGGLGIAPLLFLAQTLRAQALPPNLTIILGARNKGELSAISAGFAALDLQVHLATDDGSLGHHGLVTELIPDLLNDGKSWLICSCGPYPMMRAVAGLCNSHGWPCQVSLETMMACGISACLGCTVEASTTNSKSGPYLHVCKDGPVFFAGDIKWK